MERRLMRELTAWKDSLGRMPLLINGARQVGKTWLLREFGSRQFENVAYVVCENNPVMERVFDNYSNIEQVIRAISVQADSQVTPGRTLIILDEIQEIPLAISSLKYFCENAPEYHVAAAGSLLGVKFRKSDAPYPVGKIQTLDLHPLSFTEYLDAVGAQSLNTLLEQRDHNLISAFGEQFARHLADYYYVGGMPKAVDAFVRQNDYRSSRAIQLQIIKDYINDISKHLDVDDASRAHELWQSIPAQLGKEQGKRFFFSEVSQSGRARDFKKSLQWLIDAGLVIKVPRVSKPAIPLKHYASETLFELFFLDVGLYSAMCELDVQSVLVKNPLFAEGRGALSEQFVCQQIQSELGCTPFYWANNDNQLDFIISNEGMLYPIEVKAAQNLRSKSLRSFCKTYGLYGYRLSLAGYQQQDWMTNIPLYAVSTLLCPEAS
jgi:predicted AAA+ superfamily ATPase